MDQSPGGAPDQAAGGGAKPGLLIAVVAVLCLLSVALVGMVAFDPGLLVALLPGGLIGPTSLGHTLQVAGGLALFLPVAAAVVAHRRGRSRAAGWFVVLALLAFVPAGVAIDRGAAKARQASTVDAPAKEPCAEFSGGDTKCPGG